MISAVIGEELGLAGITAVVGLFGMFGYAGLKTAQKAKDVYGKLLVTGLTSLILVQAMINLFAVMGHGAADRRAAALRLLRQQQPDRDPARGRPDPQRRPRRPGEGGARCNAHPRWQTARHRRRALARS